MHDEPAVTDIVPRHIGIVLSLVQLPVQRVRDIPLPPRHQSAAAYEVNSQPASRPREDPHAHVQAVRLILCLRRVLIVRSHDIMGAVGLDQREVLGDAHATEMQHPDAVHLCHLSLCLLNDRQRMPVNGEGLTPVSEHLDVLSNVLGVALDIARRPTLQQLLEETIGDEVILVGYIVCGLCV